MFDFIKKFFKKKPKKRTKETTYLNLCKSFIAGGVPVKISLTDPQYTIIRLHLGLKEFYYSKDALFSLRICRYYEGKIQRLYGTKQQATNAFMSVLYMDLICSNKVFPNAYKNAFKEKLSIEEYEKIFLFNAENLYKTLRFKSIIKPENAWKKVLEYIKTLPTPDL